MPFSRTRPHDHRVLTDCPAEPPRACTSGAQPGERGIARGTSRTAEPGSGTKSLRVPTHYRLSDENSREKVQNVCGDSSAQHQGLVSCSFEESNREATKSMWHCPDHARDGLASSVERNGAKLAEEH